jgi:MFS family permease
MNHKEGTIRAALSYPAFRSLLAGLAVSQVGDWLYNLALITMVYQRTGSAMWAGAATAARVVPMVVLGPVGGVIADRFGRRGVMIASDLARLVLMLGLALIAAAHLPVVLAPVIAALATAAGPTCRASPPSRQSSSATATCRGRTPPGRPSRRPA